MITQHITLSGPGNYFISENFRDYQKMFNKHLEAFFLIIYTYYIYNYIYIIIYIYIYIYILCIQCIHYSMIRGKYSSTKGQQSAAKGSAFSVN